MKLTIERQITCGFAAALVMVGGMGFASWHSSREFVADATSVKHAQEILTRLEALLSTMTDAETGHADSRSQAMNVSWSRIVMPWRRPTHRFENCAG